jgi:hypothetical protein
VDQVVLLTAAAVAGLVWTPTGQILDIIEELRNPDDRMAGVCDW